MCSLFYSMKTEELTSQLSVKILMENYYTTREHYTLLLSVLMHLSYSVIQVVHFSRNYLWTVEFSLLSALRMSKKAYWWSSGLFLLNRRLSFSSNSVRTASSKFQLSRVCYQPGLPAMLKGKNDPTDRTYDYDWATWW